MNFQQFLSVFLLIFVAELPDKTFFATVLMASRGRPAPIFLGAAGAFVIQCAVAVLGGKLLTAFPQRWLHIGAGIMFLIFAVMSWRHRSDPPPQSGETALPSALSPGLFWRTLLSSFAVIFVAEWGDTTQLASASLVAQGQSPWLVFAASTLALWVVAGLGVTVGAKCKDRLPVAILKKVAAVIFAGVGLYLLCT